MVLTAELRDYNMGEFRSELYDQISQHHTIDQEKPKITKLLKMIYDHPERR